MFYRPGIDDHGLPHNPFKAIVSPRPIAWISTCAADGTINLAPYSYFNAIADNPPMVMFSSNGSKGPDGEGKDTLAAIRETGEFVINIVPYNLRDAMNVSSGSYPRDQDEFEMAGLEKGKSEIVKAPYVIGAPASLECVLFQEVALPAESAFVVIGEVKGVHIDEAHVKDGVFDVTSYQPLARMGYKDYSVVSDVFPLTRPGEK